MCVNKFTKSQELGTHLKGGNYPIKLNVHNLPRERMSNPKCFTVNSAKRLS